MLCTSKYRKFYAISQTFSNHQTATRVHVRDYEHKSKIRGPNNKDLPINDDGYLFLLCALFVSGGADSR